MESSSKMLSNIYPGLDECNLSVSCSCLGIGLISSLHGYRHREKSLYFLVQERSCNIHFDLLGILFYVDNIHLVLERCRYSISSCNLVLYPLDTIVMYFPRNWH